MATTTGTKFPQSLAEFPETTNHSRARTPRRNSLSETDATHDRRNPDSCPVVVSGEVTEIPSNFDPNPVSFCHQSNALPWSAITVCYAGLYKEDMLPLIIAKQRFRTKNGKFRITKFAVFLRPGTAATNYFIKMSPQCTPTYLKSGTYLQTHYSKQQESTRSFFQYLAPSLALTPIDFSPPCWKTVSEHKNN